jgi:predicted dehydrogenase
MNREEFLQTSLGWVTLAVAPKNLTSEKTSIVKSRIPVGFLGATYSHAPDKIRLALTMPDWEFVGVCETSETGRRTCEQLGAKIITQDELFRFAQVVAVESEMRYHAPHALLALKAGKHVHLEKPPGLRLSEMQGLVEIAREKKLFLQVGYMWRYNPGFKVIFEAVRQGWLGEVFLIRCYISNSLSPALRPVLAKYPGGSMFELGSHLVDAIVRLLGKPEKVTSFLRRHGNFKDELKDNNVAVLEYDHANAVIINTALQAGDTPERSFEVLGTNGTAILQPIEDPVLTLDLARPAGPYMKGKQSVLLPGYQRYKDDFTELAAAIRGERDLSVSLDEELMIHETLMQVIGMTL